MTSRAGAATFADLVLPETTARTLAELVGWARHRDEVLAQGPVTGAGGKGRGIVAMFSGGPGTGKTLAAQVVANSLGLDLHTVDQLFSAVSAYRGGLLVVSHDEAFLQRLGITTWLALDGDGGLGDATPSGSGPG